MEEHERIRISGVINDVTFANPENGFTVLELESGDELITAVGVMPELKAGELLELSGYWDFHASFGRQFRVELCEHKMPASAGDILRYLAAGGVKGIGSKLAVKIVDKFGENTLDIIENDPERLAQIRGISPEKAKQISADFKRQFAVREIMISLEKYGMTTAECVKAFNAFGVRAADIIKRNPYALCGEGVGFSFERAEFIADQLPDPPDNGYRLQAGVLHVMSHNLSNGHTCIPREKMFAPCAELLSTNEDTVDITIDELIGSGRLVSEFIDNREFLFLPHIYKAEKSSAERMKQILRFPPAGRKAADREIDRIEKKNGIKYGDLQQKAIVTAIERGLLILTGGPGTGKTTTLNGILQLFEDDGLKVALAAPTGRAAKRMSEATGAEARTIHRMLGYGTSGDRFLYDEDNPLLTDVIIVDEMSMVDVLLMRSLLRATPSGTHLIMVGDADQLPPVGPGNVLRDVIASGVVPVIRLTDIFRQAERGMIVENAHRINDGKQPDLFANADDFRFEEIVGAEQIIRRVIALCSGKTNKLMTTEPIKDAQVLVPMKKGALGAINLNARLQAALNPPSPYKKERKQGEMMLREGDKVMQIKNDYKIPWKRAKSGEEGTGVFNGDLGTIERINLSEQEVTVLFDDERAAAYDYSMLDELNLAYASTVHKSQGSEYPVVIMPIAGGAPQLMTRNLLYTAVTRAREQVFMLGSSKCVYDMVDNNQIRRRYSALKCLLMELDTIVLNGRNHGPTDRDDT